MRFHQFVQMTAAEWDAYLSRVDGSILMDRVRHTRYGIGLGPSSRTLFPSLLICSETRSHYIAELIGAQRGFTGLSIRESKEDSSERYFRQFVTSSRLGGFRLNGPGAVFSALVIGNSGNVESLRTRFPFVDRLDSWLLFSPEGAGFVTFGENFRDAQFHDCMFVTKHEEAFRVKHVLHATVVAKSISPSDYATIFRSMFSRREAVGVLTVGADRAEDLVLASQFVNTFLSPGLRETTIGEFIKRHPEVLRRALNSRRFVYEPHLRWVDGPYGGHEPAINPDLLVERKDGCYDIYDLKTAALSRKRITKGERRRRRFIDYVEEGIAQLAHYAEYFSYPGNQELALSQYGVRITNPTLVLVVGNYENADSVEVAEASRKHRGTTIIDYDSLIQLFLRSAREAAT